MGLFGCCCNCSTHWRQFTARAVTARQFNYLNCGYATEPPDFSGCCFPNCGVEPEQDTVNPLTPIDWFDAIDAAQAIVNSLDFNAPPAPGTVDVVAPNWSGQYAWNGVYPASNQCPDFRLNAYLLLPNDPPFYTHGGHGVAWFWFPDNPVTFDPIPSQSGLQFTYAGEDKLVGPSNGADVFLQAIGNQYGPLVRAYRAQMYPYSEVCFSGRDYDGMLSGNPAEEPDCNTCFFDPGAGCGPAPGPVVTGMSGFLPSDPISLAAGPHQYSFGGTLYWAATACEDCVCL